jgi:hypothetical protein
MFIITSPAKYLKSNGKTISLALAANLAAALFAAATLAAPPSRSQSVVMESGSGSLQAYGSVVYKDVEFVYGEVRHVSLTLAYYAEEASAADLFAGPVWPDAGKQVRSKAFFTTAFPAKGSEDDFDYLETKTVEFDADHWKIELISLSMPEKYVRYHYTVTYPKP